MNEIKKIRDILVKDVCSKDVKTIYLDQNIQEAAILMSKYEIGSILVIDNKNYPVGIITNDDIIQKVVQYNRLADSIICRDVMSYPLITIDPEDTLVDAMRKMSNNDIKRLVVMEGEKIYGIISASDVLKHSPDYIEILKEQIEIVQENMECVVESYTGYCQICGAWSDDLKQSEDGKFLCEDCR
ncbi:MAG: CBS domain-containing protein [Candidatus Helarchaeota archaeon]